LRWTIKKKKKKKGKNRKNKGKLYFKGKNAKWLCEGFLGRDELFSGDEGGRKIMFASIFKPVNFLDDCNVL
jgi:hypothetical protein